MMRAGPIDEKEYEVWLKQGGLEIGRENEIDTLYRVNWAKLKFVSYITCEHRKTYQRLRFNFKAGYTEHERHIISRKTAGGKELFFVLGHDILGNHVTIYNGTPAFLVKTIDGDNVL